MAIAMDDTVPGDIRSTLGHLLERQNQQGILLERISGQLIGYQALTDGRITNLETTAKGAPGTTRAWISLVIAACAGCLIPTVIGFAATVIGLLAILVPLLTK